MIYMFLADGFEETEALVTLDMLRRVGIKVKTVGIGKKKIKGAHDIKVIADLRDKKIKLDKKLDGVILPGGMPGTLNLDKSLAVSSAVEFCAFNEKLVAAICAAPIVLGKRGLLKGRNAVCFPGFEKDLEGAVISDDSVCRDDHFITAKGAGVAVQFACEIITYLKGSNTANKLLGDIQWDN